MEGQIVELNWVLGGISSVVAVLASSVAYLFKLYYVDTKTALKDCHENHKSAKLEFHQMLKEEKADCEKEISKLSGVIDSKQAQLSDLHRQVFELAQKQNPTSK